MIDLRESEIEVTVVLLVLHVISGRSQGKKEEFQDWSDGGIPSCCLTSRRIDRSSSRFWEITCKGGKDRRSRRRNRAGSGIKKGNFSMF